MKYISIILLSIILGIIVFYIINKVEISEVSEKKEIVENLDRSDALSTLNTYLTWKIEDKQSRKELIGNLFIDEVEKELEGLEDFKLIEPEEWEMFKRYVLIVKLKDTVKVVKIQLNKTSGGEEWEIVRVSDEEMYLPVRKLTEFDKEDQDFLKNIYRNVKIEPLVGDENIRTYILIGKDGKLQSIQILELKDQRYINEIKVEEAR